MKKTAIFLGLFLVFQIYAWSQELPVNFDYKRETGQETGVPMFTLNVNNDAVAYDAERGSGFEALGALIQPERDKYGLLFWNAKDAYQFSALKKISAYITIDGEKIKIPKVSVAGKNKVGRLRIEIAGLTIDKAIFWKLCKSDDVLVQVGNVKYSLDEDNILALKYLASEVKKDLARRNKSNP